AVSRGEIAAGQRLKPRAPRLLTHRLDPVRAAGGERVREGGDLEVLFGGEVRVERAVGEPGIAHDRDDGRPAEAFLPQSTRGSVEDAVQRLPLELVTPRRLPHDVHHASRMMDIMREDL